MSPLQRELTLRGVRAWRDVTDLEYGVDFEAEIRRAISDEVEAFVAYVTPAYLQSPTVWNVEVPEALARVERDPAFGIVPLFSGVSPEEPKRHCESLGLSNLSRFNGEKLAAHSAGAKSAARKRVARRTLRAAIRRRVAGDPRYVPRLLLRTFPHVTDGHLDLDVDWSSAFERVYPTDRVWSTDLLPAVWRGRRDS